MNINHSFIMQLPGIVLYKNNESRYLGCNQEFSKLLGYKNHELTIGSTDYEIPCEAANNADVYVEEDRRVLTEKRKLSFMQICRFSDDTIQALYYEKAPIFDHNQNEPTGIICLGFQISHRFLSHVNKIFVMASHDQKTLTNIQGNYAIEPELDESSNFSERETECLFYLVRGKTAKEIAKILMISSRTVESYVENLKHKTNTHTKGELIDFAFKCGYQNKIPKSIFNLLMDKKR